MARGFFVTGTDTGVGKTLAACALLQAFSLRGYSVIGMKPVAAGSDDGRHGDVDALVAASTVKAAADLVNPYAFDPPIAPHIAALQAGVDISLARIATAYRQLAACADVVVVEGAGGFMIPLNAAQTGADLARQLALPVVLVVGMRLGCLSHALLTRHAIAEQGLVCAGWVANCLQPAMPVLEENIRTLSERLEAPLLGRIPHYDRPAAVTAAACLNFEAIAGSAR